VAWWLLQPDRRWDYATYLSPSLSHPVSFRLLSPALPSFSSASSQSGRAWDETQNECLLGQAVSLHMEPSQGSQYLASSPLAAPSRSYPYGSTLREVLWLGGEGQVLLLVLLLHWHTLAGPPRPGYCTSLCLTVSICSVEQLKHTHQVVSNGWSEGSKLKIISNNHIIVVIAINSNNREVRTGSWLYPSNHMLCPDPILQHLGHVCAQHSCRLREGQLCPIR
jgi:hypothetical protein